MTDMNSLLRRRARRGFTLIEIMVVVVILGILAALVAPNVMRRIDDAQITKVKQGATCCVTSGPRSCRASTGGC